MLIHVSVIHSLSLLFCFFIYLLTGIQFGAVINRASVNIHLQVSVDIFTFLGTPGS